jgi:hypothetical protein
MDNVWKLLPRQGVGPVKLGMPADVAISAGAAFGLGEHDGTTNVLDDERYRHFVTTLGQEEADRMMDTFRGMNINPARLVILNGGVHPTFVDDKLADILCDTRATNVHVEGLRFFDGDPMPALRKLQDLNGAPPILKDLDCFFENLKVTAWGFISYRRSHRRLLSPGAVDAEQRTINLSASPRAPDIDMSKHVASSLR